MSQSLPNKRHDMAESGKAPEEALKGLGEARGPTKRGLPPVHLWNPPDCGDIDMRIAADGTWFYCGSPIGRLPLIQLFSSILRKDEERYVLVTPVEKVGIKVDDAPFLAVELSTLGEGDRLSLSFRSNVEDAVTVSKRASLAIRTRRGGGPQALCACSRRSLGFGQARALL